MKQKAHSKEEGVGKKPRDLLEIATPAVVECHLN